MTGEMFKYRGRTFFDSGHEGAFRVLGYRGVAFNVLGWEAEYDEEGELVQGSQLFAVMVGDDRPLEVCEEDLSPLKRSEYCFECGQIGCMHGAGEDN